MVCAVHLAKVCSNAFHPHTTCFICCVPPSICTFVDLSNPVQDTSYLNSAVFTFGFKTTVSCFKIGATIIVLMSSQDPTSMVAASSETSPG